MNIKSHNHWIEEIRNYLPNQSDEEIIKYSLSYTLQSLRNKENMNRFKWRHNMGKYSGCDIYDLAEALTKWSKREEALCEIGYKRTSWERQKCIENIKEIIEAIKHYQW